MKYGFRKQSGVELIARGLRYVLTGIAGVILALQANGYAIDFTHLQVEKLSLIALSSIPGGATVTIDGDTVSVRARMVNQLVYPGRYEVAVSRSDYQSWQKQFVIAPGMAAHDQPELFYETPISLGTHTAAPVELTVPFVDSRLLVIGGEVWQRNNGIRQLVTRFSEPVIAAEYLDDSHLVVTVGQAVFVLELDGTNIQQLLALPSSDPVRLVSSNQGSRLAVIQGTAAREYQLRD